MILGKKFCFTSSLLTLLLITSNLNAAVIQSEKVDIAEVWAGHPVNFALETKKGFQCVAYYNAEQAMVIAARTLGESTWNYKTLPTKTGWDSHNYIDMAIDDSGYIHVSGNMHNVNLIYFRSKKPWSIDEFEQPGMVGTLETSVTYPLFIEGPEKKLLFQYRIGGSGDGVTIWNGYDLQKKKWSRITDKGLFDNTGSVNAYSTPPALGPDSCFHIVWMWRDSPTANTNHELSHMKSTDLVNWKNMAGKTVSIPVGLSNKEVVIDPIASGKGLINMDFWISWDTQKRAVVTYHRYDSNGNSQIFNTRWEVDRWKIYQTSDWSGIKWNLDRTGSLSHDIAATPLSVDEHGKLVQNYVYPKDKNIRRWVLDEATLKPESDAVYQPPEAMKDLYKVESAFPGMQVNWIMDGEYYLRWETMPINQDNARAAGTYPASSKLCLYRFTTPTLVARNNFPETTKKLNVVNNRFEIVINTASKLTMSDFHVQLSSIDGKMLCEKAVSNGNRCVISTVVMPKGVYIIRLYGNTAETRVMTERIIIY